LILNAPANYDELLKPLPSHVILGRSNSDDSRISMEFPVSAESDSGQARMTKEFDLIQLFTTSKHDLEQMVPKLKTALKPNGSLWISWPKTARHSGKRGTSASRISSQNNLNENIIREIGLANGLVDVKVIAVDENWSGLKFVYRLKDRK